MNKIFFITAVIAGLTFGNEQNKKHDTDYFIERNQLVAIQETVDIIDDMNYRYMNTVRYVGKHYK